MGLNIYSNRRAVRVCFPSTERQGTFLPSSKLTSDREERLLRAGATDMESIDTWELSASPASIGTALMIFGCSMPDDANQRITFLYTLRTGEFCGSAIFAAFTRLFKVVCKSSVKC